MTEDRGVWMIDSSKGDDAAEKSPAALSDFIQGQSQHPHPPFNKKGDRKAVMFCGAYFVRPLGAATASFVKP